MDLKLSGGAVGSRWHRKMQKLFVSIHDALQTQGGDLADAFLSSLLPQILHDLGQVFLPGRTPVFPAMR